MHGPQPWPSYNTNLLLDSGVSVLKPSTLVVPSLRVWDLFATLSFQDVILESLIHLAEQGGQKGVMALLSRAL